MSNFTTNAVLRHLEDVAADDDSYYTTYGNGVINRTPTKYELPMNLVGFASLFILGFFIVFMFLTCFVHSQLSSPLFVAPRRHRTPFLVPLPLPTYTSKTTTPTSNPLTSLHLFTSTSLKLILNTAKSLASLLLISDDAIINKVGLDALIFLRFHRMSTRIIFKMSVFSLLVLLPLNYTGYESKRVDIIDNGLLFTDFQKFSMANVSSASPRLWFHAAGAVLLTGVVVSELVNEYGHYNKLRHRYLLSEQTHLRTVMVSNIQQHMRSRRMIRRYFENVYHGQVKEVVLSENLIYLETLVEKRENVLSVIERIILNISQFEKISVIKAEGITGYIGKCLTYCKSWIWRHGVTRDGYNDLLVGCYDELEELNKKIEAEISRRKMVMDALDDLDVSEKNSCEHDATLASSVFEGGCYYNNGSKKSIAAAPEPAAAAKTATLLSPPLPTPPLTPDNIENHINETTSKAFVTFHTYMSTSTSCQAIHSTHPGYMTITPAPEPKDVMWNNIYVSSTAKGRTVLAQMLTVLLIFVYSIPITLISLLVSTSALVKQYPSLGNLIKSSKVFSVCVGMIQPLCVVLVQQLLPPIFIAVGIAEGNLSFCDINTRAFSRYFAFNFVNVFLVPTIATSTFDTAALIAENPGNGFTILGYSLPKTSSFFCSYVVLKCSLGLGVELVRIIPIIQSLIRSTCFNLQTFRDRANLKFSLRPIDNPGFLPIHKVLAQDLLVVLIAIVFAVISPLVLIPCGVYCAMSRIVWTHQYLYVYENVGESGGSFFPFLYRRLCFALLFSQSTILGLFMLKNAYPQAYVIFVLMIGTYYYLKGVRVDMARTSGALPLEIASVMDIDLINRRFDDNDNDNDNDRAKREKEKDKDKGDPNLNLNAPSLYSQPVLRASPRARMNASSFPPAMLNVSLSDVSCLDLNAFSDDSIIKGNGGGDGEGNEGICKAYDFYGGATRKLEIYEAWGRERGKTRSRFEVFLVMIGLKRGVQGLPVLEEGKEEEGGVGRVRLKEVEVEGGRSFNV